jgi:hypothetical protein
MLVGLCLNPQGVSGAAGKMNLPLKHLYGNRLDRM